MNTIYIPNTSHVIRFKRNIKSYYFLWSIIYHNNKYQPITEDDVRFKLLNIY